MSMKQIIRMKTFETNSSSTHSLCILSKEDFDKFEKGEIYVNRYSNEVKTFEDLKREILEKNDLKEIIEAYKDYLDYEYETDDEDDTETFENNAIKRWIQEDWDWTDYDSYLGNRQEMETFEYSYTTKSGDEIVVFGYYGYDG